MYVCFSGHHVFSVENSHIFKPSDLSLFRNCVQNIKYLKRIKKIKSLFLCCSFIIYTMLNSNRTYLIYECHKISHPPSQILNSHKLPLRKLSHNAEVIILSVMNGSSNVRKLLLPSLLPDNKGVVIFLCLYFRISEHKCKMDYINKQREENKGKYAK